MQQRGEYIHRAFVFTFVTRAVHAQICIKFARDVGDAIPRHFVPPPFIDWCELHMNFVHIRYTYSRFAERGLRSSSNLG